MRTQDQLLTSRSRVSERYALMPLEGIPDSRLPEWPGALVRVLAAPALGADFVEYRIELEAGEGGSHEADGEIEHFLYQGEGTSELSIDGASHSLTQGGYALVPPESSYELNANTDGVLLLLKKRYEPVPGIPSFEPLVGNQAEVEGQVYMGDPGTLLQPLIPDELTYDLAMNVFTFQTGHSLPIIETHVMEHGVYILEGKGIYYLDDHWTEVEATDFIWLGPYCPQSYYAAGPTPTRYIYYKNVNRDIPL